MRKKATAELAKNIKRTEVVTRFASIDECLDDRLNFAKSFCEDTDFLSLRCNVSSFIENNLGKTLEYCDYMKTHKIAFTAECLHKVFEMLVKMTNIINEFCRYEPTIITYCQLLGISLSTFNNYSNQNCELGEEARIVQDYFKGTLVQTMALGMMHPNSGAFIGKSLLGMRESDNNNLNINVIGGELSLKDIMAEYDKIKN